MASTVNELSFRIPGMLSRDEWESTLELLRTLDTDKVLNNVLDVLAVRHASLDSRYTMDNWAAVGVTDGSGYRR